MGRLFFKVQSLFLSAILLFVISFQEVHAQAINVPAGGIEVTPSEFNDLKKNEIRKNEDSGSNGALGLNFFSGSGGKDGAVLIFAVVGVVVVVAWVPYMALLAYRSITNPGRYEHTHLLSTQAMGLKSSEHLREGLMSSTRYTWLTTDLDGNNNFHYGLNAEIGYYNFHERSPIGDFKQYYHSPFWLAGPAFLIGGLKGEGSFPLFLGVDLLAGTSFHQDVNLILKAELKLYYFFNNGLFLGPGVTSLYLDGREGKGIITHTNNLDIQANFTIGYKF